MQQREVESHNHSMSIKMPEVVRELVDLLGMSLVAAIGGVGETRAVAAWMEDRAPQRPQVLRFALQLARMVAGPADSGPARAWFQGSNPLLDDRSPVMVLRTQDLDSVQVALIAAARTFANRDGGA